MMQVIYLAYIVATDFKLSAKDAGVPNAGSNGNDVLTGVLNMVYFSAGVAAVITIVVAGILYATADGDAGKVKTARNAILYAVIGPVAVLMAFVITGFILGRF